MGLTLRDLRPVIPLPAAQQVARVGESRHPAPIFQHRVPSDMIDVQMRADYAVDRLARVAGLFQVRQERPMLQIPAREFARLVVADAGIDQNPQAARLHHHAVEAHADSAFLVGEARQQPVGFLKDILGVHVFGDDVALPQVFALQNLDHLKVSDSPFAHCAVLRAPGLLAEVLPPPLAQKTRPINDRWTIAGPGKLVRLNYAWL